MLPWSHRLLYILEMWRMWSSRYEHHLRVTCGTDFSIWGTEMDPLLCRPLLPFLRQGFRLPATRCTSHVEGTTSRRRGNLELWRATLQTLSHCSDLLAAMCQYRYYYYGGCRHSETVLFDFCERAVPAARAAAPAAPALEPEIVEGKHPQHKHHPSGQGHGSGSGSGSGPAQLAGVGERSASISSPLFTGLSSLHPAASSHDSAASIPAYPSHTSPHETALSEQDMAGLPTFSGSALRRFMIGSSAAQQYGSEQKVSDCCLAASTTLC